MLRPFEILTSMDAESRARIAAHLGVRLERLGGDAQAEAWAILHRDLLGMQARGHVAIERLLPLRNITWREMLQRTARWCRLPADGSVDDLERRIVEAFADRIVATWRPEEVSLSDAMAQAEPWVLRLRERLELSRNGVRLAVRSFSPFAWVETLGTSAMVARSISLRERWARANLGLAVWIDRVARAAPFLRVPIRAAAGVAALVSLLFVSHHAQNAPVVVTLVLQSFHRSAAEPTAAFWNSL